MRGPDGPAAAVPGLPAAGADAAPARQLSRGRRTAWGAEAVAVLAGWALAIAALLPPGGQPAVPFDLSSGLFLAAVLAFWALAVWIVRSDLADFLIPDAASAALAALGLALAAALSALGASAAEAGPAALAAAAGAAATGAGAFAVFWAIGAGFRALGRDALGHGDVKLAGALAVWLSPADAALALELAALAAVLALVASRHGGASHGASARRGPLRDTAVPFGAFLAPAAWLVLVLAPELRAAGWLPW